MERKTFLIKRKQNIYIIVDTYDILTPNDCAQNFEYWWKFSFHHVIFFNIK